MNKLYITFKNKYLIYLISLYFFIGCEKEIDLDLDTSDPQLVIEATVSDSLEYQKVIIQYSKPFTENNNIDFIKGANVIVSDNEGNVYNYIELNGIYLSETKFKGKPNNTYYLKIIVNNNTYTATSKMPKPVKITGITFIENVFGSNKDSQQYLAIPEFTDPVDDRNYYLIKSFVNDYQDRFFNVRNDIIGNGLPNERPIFSEFELINPNKLTVELYSIDEKVYNYFYVLEQNSDSNTLSPSNPPSNISNGSFGYFSAYSMTKYSKIVPL